MWRRARGARRGGAGFSLVRDSLFSLVCLWMPLTTSSIVLLWAVVLVVLGYAGLLLRYHYRTPDTVTILQCTPETFHADLLRERQPLVCTGMDTTSVYADLRDHLPAHDASIYARLRSAPWFGRGRPVRACPVDGPWTRTLCDVRWLVQVAGTSRVRIALPDTTPNADPDVEIVLREGDALAVPFLWQFQMRPADTSTSESTPRAAPCRCMDVAWENQVLHGLTRWLYVTPPPSGPGAPVQEGTRPAQSHGTPRQSRPRSSPTGR